ncbi:MAG: hypothetical protein FD174_3306 [Geobacteraceae bacterium]|nr:MAG: hypothetical protein FD174_3306 [Geobacteraceae bacterium]
MPYRFIISLAIVTLLAAHPVFGALKILTPPRTGQKSGQAQEEKVSPVNVLSIVPAQGEPGISVTLYGTGFTDKTTAFLGNQEVPTRVLGPKQLSFDIPKLEAGLYALFLKRADGATSRIYNFTIMPQKPVATSLSPDKIDACSTGRDREVTVNGYNFQEKSQILFDGAGIRSRFQSSESISFMVPQVAAGLHNIQVKNTEDAASGVLGLLIDSKPEMESITQGETYVNYYNLIITGRNFQQGAALAITEEKSLEATGSPLAVDTKRIYSGTTNATERERVIFINCNRMIYQRYPYSPVQKSFTVQVINPNGEESSVVSVSAP